MRPDEREFDDEIRGHLALSIQERIERGEDPASARRAALQEFGYVPAIRDSMRRVGFSRGLEAVDAFWQDVRVGLRSLGRAKGLAATVIVTLALGIGANAAIFSVVRGVLLRPLANRGEATLVYLRQSAPGLDVNSIAFSVPEIADLKSRVTTIADFGDFSTVDFTMLGLGKPRVVKSGVVSGSYFEVMGLRPVLGRLITPTDDGKDAAPVAVLTHRFWSTELEGDAAVVGKTIQLGRQDVLIVGVLEPSVPYPADTQIIANVVTSPHHLEATMVTGRTHRMTELFGRLATGASLEDARAELASVHAAMMAEHPDAYSTTAGVQIALTPLRDEITSAARRILLMLLVASGMVFVIACSNAANLILTRSVRREGELTVRAALGAGRGALRRTLLAESVVLCGAGALIGVALARPLVALVAAFTSRYSVRALDVTVDVSVLWVGAGLAMAAAVLLAYVPRLPGSRPSPRRRGSATHRLRVFATAQVALSFVLLAGAGIALATLVTLQTTLTGYDMKQVLAIDVPMAAVGIGDMEEVAFYQEVTRRVAELPDVEDVASGSFVPWRDAGSFGVGLPIGVEGRPAEAGRDPHARFRIVSPRFFAVLGVPLLAGRDFTADDTRGSERVVIVSQSVVRSLFPDGDAVNQSLWWTDPIFAKRQARRIVGVVADVDDEHLRREDALTIYHPVSQIGVAGRLFVRASGDPYALVPQVRQTISEVSPQRPVERPATLEDVRADVLAPNRLNTLVIAGFAGIAMLIAVVGVSGVLAFSVSARTAEFGVRLALGSSPRRLLLGVLSEGALIVAIGIAAGAAGGFGLAEMAARSLDGAATPGVVPILGAAVVLAGAAIGASLLPAARAARVDVLQALRSE
jgi:predicted permease